MPLPVVAIVGRPNVGKSTLFNRLIGFKKSLVHDRPGVTRDRLYEPADLLDRRVLLVDTGGFEPQPDTDLLLAMRRQSLIAVEEADVILLVADAQAGWTHADDEVVAVLRRAARPVILAVNKVDGPRHHDLVADFWGLGIDDVVPISAEHGQGMYELAEAVCTRLPERTADEDPEPEEDDGALPEGWDAEGAEVASAATFSGPIRIAVLGRPNIGKSTLVNRLIGEERHLVFDLPGTTTDPVDSEVTVDGQDYVLVDTAGVRKRARIDDAVERFVSLRAIRSIERCHVTCLMIDATEGPTDQDARLADLVLERGRGLILLVNKWDAVKELPDVDSRQTEEALRDRLPHASFAPFLFISARTGKGCQRILPLVQEVFAAFNTRIPTARLNRFLERVTVEHTPPQRSNHPVRLYYMSQTRVRPPTFVAFSNVPEGITPAYQRYLVNSMRAEFGMLGAPVRLVVRRRRKPGEEAAP
ncbi:MAG TPA: ribosome biogenesis GTPase Der [Myxococcota bacterium]|nr:ribosome biogenesis GTPase Der [Myxococcota bacterium]